MFEQLFKTIGNKIDEYMCNLYKMIFGRLFKRKLTDFIGIEV